MFALVATPVIAQDVVDVGAISDTPMPMRFTAQGKFVVVAASAAGENNGIETLNPSVQLRRVRALPNLADILRFGGTIEVLVLADTYAGIAAGDDAAAIKTKIDAVKNAVIVSEIMWGLDLSQLVADQAQAQSQWIELYVHSTGKLAADETSGDINIGG